MNAPAVEVKAISKRFGDVIALADVSLSVRRGEFLTLLGPSGCGKTTLLRLVAGFESPDSGTILLEGRDVSRTPPQHRNVNQVFQSYALFPHLSVNDNVAFGLRRQGLSGREIADRVAEAVALVALQGCERRRPHELSGGQRQRVGLARAIAPRPATLLLDEPLSALDARLRQSMQFELRRLQQKLGMTFILVTHDQEEALSMSDRIALLQHGRIEQVGDVRELYDRPSSAFAAEFIGEANLLDARFVALKSGTVEVSLSDGTPITLPSGAWPQGRKSGQLAIRPEKIHTSLTPLEGDNVFAARVDERVFRGAIDRLVLVTPNGLRLLAITTSESMRRAPLRAGDQVWAAIHSAHVVVLPPAQQRDVASSG